MDEFEKEVTLCFAGDIGFDKYMEGRYKDADLLDDEVRTFLLESDHLFVNVEGPLTARKQVIRPNGVAALVHSMDPGVSSFLTGINADVWNICNNHIMDAGPEGLADTLKLASECTVTRIGKREAAGPGEPAYIEQQVRTLGAGMNIDEASRPLILPEAGGIGIIGVGYQRACRKADETTPGCFSWSDLPLIRKRIAQIREKCRWCIVVAHAGEEFTSLPSPYTRQRYIDYLDMGADFVVAHHPHVTNNYELFDEGRKAVFYSLGNFVFDTDYQRAQYNTERGVLLKLHLTNSNTSETLKKPKACFEAIGILVDRKQERIVKDDLPRIFANVPEEEYKLLAPLAAKQLVAATKRQQTFLMPEKYANATEEDWQANFMEEKRSGRVPSETLDFQIICPLAAEAEKGEWKKSTLESVKEYILEQM